MDSTQQQQSLALDILPRVVMEQRERYEGQISSIETYFNSKYTSGG